MDVLPIAFWGGLAAVCFLAGWAAGARRAYRHGFEDGLELAADDLSHFNHGAPETVAPPKDDGDPGVRDLGFPCSERSVSGDYGCPFGVAPGPTSTPRG